MTDTMLVPFKSKLPNFFPPKLPTFKNGIAAAVYWCTERQSILQNRLAGKQPPWTSDIILHSGRFCNVCREDDRTTIWIDKEIRQHFAGHHALWFMLSIGRWINLPATLQDLINSPQSWPSDEGFSCRALGDFLEARLRKGVKTFGSAYKISALGETGNKGQKVGRILAPLWRDRAEFEDHFANKPTLASTHKLYMKYDGFGPFMAYQVLVDQRHTRLLNKARDIGTWCACGPGTIRGLNRIHGRSLTRKPPEKHLREECLELWGILKRETDIKLDLSDVPNICCETDKYLRVHQGEGQMKVKYVA